MYYNVSRRKRKYLALEKAKLLCNTFINSQFDYAPLGWMFCRKKTIFKDSKNSLQSTKGGIYDSNKNYD